MKMITKWFYRFRNAVSGKYISRRAYEELPEIERVKHRVRHGE